MQLTKTIFPNSAIFIEKKRVENRLWRKSEFFWRKKIKISHRTLKGLDPEINPERPPKSYKDAASRKDSEQWEEAMMKEYRGFKDMKSLAVVKPRKGARLHDTLTMWEYKKGG
jgi:hypothetical protein